MKDIVRGGYAVTHQQLTSGGDGYRASRKRGGSIGGTPCRCGTADSRTNARRGRHSMDHRNHNLRNQMFRNRTS